MQCPMCQAEIEEESGECPACGQALCPACGAAVDAEDDACPVCGVAGTRDNWQAYLSMSVMLSVVPLGFIGGIATWIYFKSKN